jgi:DNA-binding NtrC family response regulator
LATAGRWAIVGDVADPRAAILVVDDDVDLGKVLVALLARQGYACERATSGEEGLAMIEARPFDAVLTDLRMPGMDGMLLLKEVGRRWPSLPVVLLTAHGSIPAAVEAMRAGAVDFVLKPFDDDDLARVVRTALARTERERDAVPSARIEGPIGSLGESAAMREVTARIQKAAAGTATVLVRGETGTGKELVATALHEASPRKAGPLIKVNCGALAETLLESELFGHEKGAFTGAVTRKPGRVELAHKGTLFLDEIGDVPLTMQGKLLRVLQEREIERVGGGQTIKVDVRFVAATHRDLEAMVTAGTFREDLFFRLNVVPIHLPPLRDRAGDVEKLAERFCVAFAEANGRSGVVLDRGALAFLATQPWPGNVRQLQNLVERLVILSGSDVITARDVEHELGRAPLGAVPPSSARPDKDASLPAQVRSTEKDALLHALARTNGNKTAAARLLGVSLRTLYNKLGANGLA